MPRNNSAGRRETRQADAARRTLTLPDPIPDRVMRRLAWRARGCAWRPQP